MTVADCSLLQPKVADVRLSNVYSFDTTRLNLMFFLRIITYLGLRLQQTIVFFLHPAPHACHLKKSLIATNLEGQLKSVVSLFGSSFPLCCAMEHVALSLLLGEL